MSKTENKFQVVLNIRYDEYGKEDDKFWTINQWTYKWFRWAWRPITHVDCGWGDCHRVVTRFKSRDEALKLIQLILDEKPVDTWTETIDATLDETPARQLSCVEPRILNPCVRRFESDTSGQIIMCDKVNGKHNLKVIYSSGGYDYSDVVRWCRLWSCSG